MTTEADPRAEYRRRLRHRQATIIGGTSACLAALVVVSLLVWTGVLPSLYEPGFSSPSDGATPVVQPCPPADAVTVELASFSINVYNGTDAAGLAGTVADELSDSGLTVANTADWPRGSYDGDIQLTTSTAGLANAYTLAQIFTGTVVVQIDETQDPADPTVSVVLGEGYKAGILSSAEIGILRGGEPIVAPTGCAAATTAATEAPATSG